MWCADCERDVVVEDNIHYVYVWEGGSMWICQGQFYTSAPPELPENWYVLPEPDADEQEIMDQNAELLLFDLGSMEK